MAKTEELITTGVIAAGFTVLAAWLLLGDINGCPVRVIITGGHCDPLVEEQPQNSAFARRITIA